MTGMSGTGKSSVLAELARRGHPVLDTDDPGWIRQLDGEPLWDLDRLTVLLDEHRGGSLFISGCVANQGMLYERFDIVVLLSAPIEVLLARVTNRGNPFGATAADRAKITEDLATFEPLLRAGADREFVSTMPVIELAGALERIATDRA